VAPELDGADDVGPLREDLSQVVLIQTPMVSVGVHPDVQGQVNIPQARCELAVEPPGY
jgi:hypothetical protein